MDKQYEQDLDYLYRQADGDIQEELAEYVKSHLLEYGRKRYNYYDGGFEQTLENILQRYGGQFAAEFEHGFAGYNSIKFYVGFNYWDSAFKIVKPQIKPENYKNYAIVPSDLKPALKTLEGYVDFYIEQHG